MGAVALIPVALVGCGPVHHIDKEVKEQRYYEFGSSGKHSTTELVHTKVVVGSHTRTAPEVEAIGYYASSTANVSPDGTVVTVDIMRAARCRDNQVNENEVEYRQAGVHNPSGWVLGSIGLALMAGYVASGSSDGSVVDSGKDIGQGSADEGSRAALGVLGGLGILVGFGAQASWAAASKEVTGWYKRDAEVASVENGPWRRCDDVAPAGVYALLLSAGPESVAISINDRSARMMSSSLPVAFWDSPTWTVSVATSVPMRSHNEEVRTVSVAGPVATARALRVEFEAKAAREAKIRAEDAARKEREEVESQRRKGEEIKRQAAALEASVTKAMRTALKDGCKGLYAGKIAKVITPYWFDGWIPSDYDYSAIMYKSLAEAMVSSGMSVGEMPDMVDTCSIRISGIGAGKASYQLVGSADERNRDTCASGPMDEADCACIVRNSDSAVLKLGRKAICRK